MTALVPPCSWVFSELQGMQRLGKGHLENSPGAYGFCRVFFLSSSFSTNSIPKRHKGLGWEDLKARPALPPAMIILKVFPTLPSSRIPGFWGMSLCVLGRVEWGAVEESRGEAPEW